MNSIQKLVSGRLRAQASGPHPDADLLSAFADNALADLERTRVLAHLADCGNCREILFLCLPESADAQKVLRLGPSRKSLALRWGTLAASIVAIAGVFVARHELLRVPAHSAKLVSAPVAPISTKVAEEKIPTDLENMREDQVAKKSLAAPARMRPEEKHMTAKLQGTLNFEKSDQVRVSRPASPSLRMDSGTIQHMPTQGRDFADLKELPAPLKDLPKTANTPAQQMNEIANDKAGTVYVPTSVGIVAKQSPAKPNLDGVVLDPAGAVIPNAKVTAGGPVVTETVTSDSQGRFAFDLLSPGLYSVKAEANGFRSTELKQVEVAANRQSSLQLKLDLSASAETVEVTAQAAAVETTSSTVQVESATPAHANRKKSRDEAHKLKAASVAGPVAGLTLPALHWTLSPEGAVQRSSDGGKTWQAVKVAPNATFRALSAVGASIWVGGPGGALYHSADSGDHWTQITPAMSTQKLQADVTRIDFMDSLNGTLTTSNGETWTTLDGGASWQRNSAPTQ